MKKIFLILFLFSCSHAKQEPIGRLLAKKPERLCNATYKENEISVYKETNSYVALYVYETLGSHTVDQLRCLIATEFATVNFLQRGYDFKVITFYNLQTHEGLIYFFSRKGVLGVLVLSNINEETIRVRNLRYRGPVEHLSAIFDTGSVYIPLKFKFYDDETIMPVEELPHQYRRYGNVINLEGL